MQYSVAALVVFSSLAFAFGSSSNVELRQSADNLVSINNGNSFCMMFPRTPHTDIGDSEHANGEKTYCSASARTSSQQGLLPNGFWSNVQYTTGRGRRGGGYKQLTGCIRPQLVDRLNSGDMGGQYDSNGGIDGKGNPAGSKCVGYRSYVELIEPGKNRACIRCCNDPADCPVTLDTKGCPNVIPGNYFNCGK